MNVNTPRVQVPVNVNIPSPALAHQASQWDGGWQQGKWNRHGNLVWRKGNQGRAQKQ